MAGLFDYFRQIVAPQPRQTVPPPQQQVQRSPTPPAAAAPTPIQPTVVQPQSAQSAAIAARYGTRYAGYEELITERPGGGYDLRAADAAIAADLRREEVQSLSGYGLTRYQFQQAGEARRQAVSQIQAARGNIPLQQSILPRYQQTVEREWGLGLQLERGWLRGEIPPTGPTPPRVGRGVLQVRGEVTGGVLPEMTPITAIPKSEFKQSPAAGRGLFVVGIGERAISLAKLPETVTIEGIGGNKTISTKEYLRMYEPVGAGSLLEPRSLDKGVQLKSEFVSPVEALSRWWGKSERMYAGVAESVTAEMPVLRQAFSRTFWTETAERARGLPGGVRGFVQFGAGTAEQIRSAPMLFVGSLAASSIIRLGAPLISARVAAAPAGSLLARGAPWASRTFTVGMVGLGALWGSQKAVAISRSPMPSFEAGKAAAEILPWVTPFYIERLPGATRSLMRVTSPRGSIDWTSAGTPLRREPGQKLEEIKILDVRDVRVIDIRPEVDLTKLDLPRALPRELIPMSAEEMGPARMIDVADLQAIWERPGISLTAKEFRSPIKTITALELGTKVRVMPVLDVSLASMSVLRSSIATSAIADVVVGRATATKVSQRDFAAVFAIPSVMTSQRIDVLVTPQLVAPLEKVSRRADAILIPRIGFPTFTPTFGGGGFGGGKWGGGNGGGGSGGGSRGGDIFKLPGLPNLSSFGHGGGGGRRPLGAFRYRKWQSVLMPGKALSFKVKGLDFAFGGKPKKGRKNQFSLRMKGPKRIRI